MNKAPRNILLPIIFCLMLKVLSGCASVPPGAGVLAVVDGEAVTTGDLEYSLQIAHRREDLSSAGTLNMSVYLQKLIGDRLIVQEARRIGMDEYPGMKEKVDAFILRESVVKLYSDEIRQKISVGEKEAWDQYRKDYERFVVGIIENGSEADAGKVHTLLAGGGDFKELAAAYSTHVSKKDGGIMTYLRRSLGPFWEDTLLNMKPGEISGVRKSGDKYYIAKLIEREEAPESGFQEVSAEIEARIRKQKTSERSTEYLKELREKYAPLIHNDVLSAISFSGSSEKRDEWLRDRTPLVEIGGSVLTAGEFTAMISSDDDRVKDNVLNQWIDRKVVDIEALGRHYEQQTDLRDMTRRYQDQILKNAFITDVIVPGIQISDKEMKEYYEAHSDEFIRPVLYRIQQISVRTREEADAVLKSLREGASFSWTAKERSVDSYAGSDGNAGWKLRDQLPLQAQAFIDALKPGEISDVFEAEQLYMVIRLQERSGGVPEEYRDVQNSVKMKLFGKKFNELFDDYVDKLRKDAEITIYEDNVRSVEAQMRGHSHGQ